ncbi:MAG: nitroreductase family protein [Mangrovibacterium sp.]
MKVLSAIQNRYSERMYKSKRIKNEEMNLILEAARLAPSACNRQPWKFIVISDKDNLEKVYAAYPKAWFSSAPQVIVACGEYDEAWRKNSDEGKSSLDLDVAIAIDHMTIQAAELGVGTCWICAFDEELVKELLQLPDNVQAIALIPVGYPASATINKKDRKDLKEIVFYEKYGQTLLNSRR